MGLMIRDFFLIGIAGLGMEVCFTAFFASLKGDANVSEHNLPMGFSHPYYILTYGSIAITFGLWGQEIFGWNPVVRYFFFAGYAFVFETLQNLLLRYIHGDPPSGESYRNSGKALFGGLVRWDFPFAFGLAGFLFQWTYQSIH